MPTKTDRILSYLPPTFRALPRPTALYAVADAAGEQLLQAENSLGAVMLSHWVDHADLGAEFIADLACFAALYGLAPRGGVQDVARFQTPTCLPFSADETVEEFREHLKRYVLTFLDGTVTVQGILRIVAEALGIHIADSYADMDTWWTRGNDAFVSVERRGNDASELLFGAGALKARGSAVTRAQVTASRDLGNGELPAGSKLRIKLDGAEPVDVSLSGRSMAALDVIVSAINQRFPERIASNRGGLVSLASPTIGAGSRLELIDVDLDAAPALLGLAPRIYRGTPVKAASAIGVVDLSGKNDLSEHRYLRLTIDDSHLAEIDCAGPDPAATTLPEIVSAINHALGRKIASAEGAFLKLTSPTKGPASTIGLGRAAAQDAQNFLIGVDILKTWGLPAQPAEVGRAFDPVSSATVDLSSGSRLRLAIDGGPPAIIDCAGANPKMTKLTEIVSAINEAMGADIAAIRLRPGNPNAGALLLTSPKTGPSSQISFLPLPDNEATEPIFGIRPRVYQGADAASARVAGTPDLSRGVDLRAQHTLLVSVDGRPPTPIDFWTASQDLLAVTLPELRSAMNAALGPGIASDDGKHLVLTSKSTGAGSRIEFDRQEVRTRRFVTRAYITDDPVLDIFGFLRQTASGQAATAGVLRGKPDLSRGVDLRHNRYMQVLMDSREFKQVDCARGVRIPRSATLDEIVSAINTQLGVPIASHDGKHLTLTSLITGSSSSINARDPWPVSILLGFEPTQYFGRDATDILFEGTVGLSDGVDLSEADRIMISADGGEPVEIACAGADPAHTTLNEIIESINLTLGAHVASHHGKLILLAATPHDGRSKLEFAVPPARDATAAIFGFRPPRVYVGDPATKAIGEGTIDLSKGIDLTITSPLLRISVDGGPKVDVDCGKEAADPAHARLDEIVNAINHAVGAPVASDAGGRLVLTSRKSGKASRVVVEPDLALGSAAVALFGPISVLPENGRDPLPAVIRGHALKSTLDLTGRRVLRVVVDSAEPVDIDVAGEEPDKTSLHEIVGRINAVLPGVAAANNGSVVLTSPTVGQPSSMEVLPQRALELIDYPPVPVTGPAHQVQHGSRFSVDNNGAAATGLEFEVTAPQGDSGIEFVDRAAGARVRVMSVLRPGDRLSIGGCGETGLEAVITEPAGALRIVPDSSILVGTLGAEAMVPFPGEWLLARGAGADQPPLLQLNDPSAPAIVVLRGLEGLQPDDRILVQVTPAKAVTRSIGAEPLFDVAIRLVTSRPTLTETYSSVTIGRGPSADSLTVKILTAPSRFVRAQEIAKSDILKLALGRSEFTYMDCHEARFDHAWFPNLDADGRPEPSQAEETRFAGGGCREFAVFDISRFSNGPPEQETAYFAPPKPLPDPPVDAAVNWTRYQPGALVVNLPADLDEEFGSRFDQDRFGLPAGKPEQYNGVITEPATDPDYIVKRINARSTLVTASVLHDPPPPGFEFTTMPFLHPRSHTLSGGSDTQSATIYLAENGVPGLIELRARVPGAWGNTIAVTSRQAGAVRFDMTVGYEGVRFENARLVALAGRILKPREDPLAQLAAQILKPGPVGVLQAKAAGVRADVTRDRTEIPPENSCRSKITGKT